MSEWITDRKPTQADADAYGYVWVTINVGIVTIEDWYGITEGTPWMPTSRPAPYVKPKRYVAEHKGIGTYWRVRDTRNGELCNIAVADEATIRKLEDFLNEVMP